MIAVVRAELEAALRLLGGIDYEEGSRIDRAVVAIENARAALDQTEERPPPWKSLEPNP